MANKELNLNFYIKKNHKQEYAYNDVFLNKQYKYIHCYGGSRSGKTFLVIDYFIDCCLKYAGSRHLIFRKNYSSLRIGVIDQTIPNLFKIFGQNSGSINFFDLKISGKPFVKWADDKHKLVFFNGSEIVFFGSSQASGGNSIEKILSTEWGNILKEEANECDFSAIEDLDSRLTQVVSDFQGNLMPNKSFTTENPTSFKSWTYVMFFDKKNPTSKENLPQPERYIFLKFSPEDNLENLSEEYLATLRAMSPKKRQRYLHGEYGDSFDGEIFKQLYYQDVPDWSIMDKIAIYCDPSYKSGIKNDYKSVVTVGQHGGTIYILNVMAIKGTTYEMIGLIHRQQESLRSRLREKQKQPSIRTYIESQGLADDFRDSFDSYCEKNKCIINYEFDRSKKGDKFTRIESLLVPLNEQGLMFFNKELISSPFHEQIEVQFLNFSPTPKKDIHDDIPDSIHGAVKKLQDTGINFFVKDVYKKDNMASRGY